MSRFAVTVRPLTIAPHPNADLLELAGVGDYRSVVAKGSHRTGDLGAYIPEGAVLPAAVIERLGLTGKLAGPAQDRVKAVRLRQELSQGIVFPLERAGAGWALRDPANGALHPVRDGDDVTALLGITKYVPDIPECLLGEVYHLGSELTVSFDIENIKMYPQVFHDGEPVVITEKLHGTFAMFGYLPPAFVERFGGHPENARRDGVPGEGFVSSKGLGDQGLVFKHNDRNAGNVYVRAFTELGILGRMAQAFAHEEQPVLLLGEIFGAGVQDLHYGQTGAAIALRGFDVLRGSSGDHRALDDAALDLELARLGLERVPVLARGPFSKALVEQWTSGKETVSGRATHLREGVVVKPVTERRDPSIGRVLLKSVSAEYLLRKGRATEYQ